mgnify:CR=1 FL=1
MAKSNTKIIYEEKEDILYLSKCKKVKASIEIEDFIIDIDMDGYVSGIEVLNASENLQISPAKLKQIEKAKMNIIYKPNYVYIFLLLKLKKEKKEVALPLTISLGHPKVKKEVVFVKS